jgi:hypothetical protein
MGYRIFLRMEPKGIYVSQCGADLDAIEPFTSELAETVVKMKEALVNERPILEGTDVPEYGKGDWSLIHIEKVDENEPSPNHDTEIQWRSDLQNGCLTTDPIHTSTPVSDSLFDSAELLNPAFPSDTLRESCAILFRSSCSERSDGCGTETDAMNESSECTVPMTSEQTDGMPSEEK